MVDYSVRLEHNGVVHAPNLGNFSGLKATNYLVALSEFNTDEKKDELSGDEIFAAYNYFVELESKISNDGRKNDGILTSKDIKRIVQTDPKFYNIRQKYNFDDNKVSGILTNIIASISSLSCLDTNAKVLNILEDSDESGKVVIRTRLGNKPHSYSTLGSLIEENNNQKKSWLF